MTSWQQHITCTQIMRRHPDWDDEQVRVAAGMHPAEMDVVREARREVTADQPSVVRSQRSY